MKRVAGHPFAALAVVAAAAATTVPGRAVAQQADTPYWASLSADKVNLRVGPARDYRIAWIYRRHELPLKVVRQHEGWRLVEDPDGTRGWVLSRFLSRRRTAVVRGGIAEMLERPGAGRVLWRLAPGVVTSLGDCAGDWCRIELRGHPGYARADHLWGDGDP